jgi:hypothetical protein
MYTGHSASFVLAKYECLGRQKLFSETDPQKKKDEYCIGEVPYLTVDNYIFRDKSDIQLVRACLPHVEASPTEQEVRDSNQTPRENGQCEELEWTESEATVSSGIQYKWMALIFSCGHRLVSRLKRSSGVQPATLGTAERH